MARLGGERGQRLRLRIGVDGAQVLPEELPFATGALLDAGGACTGHWQWVDPGAGGNTHSLAFHPLDPSVLFVGSDVNGLLRARNAGGPLGTPAQWSFESFGRGLGGHDVTALAMGTSDPDASMFCVCSAGRAALDSAMGRRFLYRYDPSAKLWSPMVVPGYTWVGAPAFGVAPPTAAPAFSPAFGHLLVVDVPTSPPRPLLIGLGPSVQPFEFQEDSGRAGFVRIDRGNTAPAVVAAVPDVDPSNVMATWRGAAYQYSPSAPATWMGKSGIGSAWTDPRIAWEGGQWQVDVYFTVVMAVAPEVTATTPTHSHLVRARLSVAPSGSTGAPEVSEIRFAPIAILPSFPAPSGPVPYAGWATYGGFAEAVDLSAASDELFAALNAPGDSSYAVVPHLEFGQVAGHRAKYGAEFWANAVELMVSLPRFDRMVAGQVPSALASERSALGRKYALLRVVVPDEGPGTPTPSASWCSKSLLSPTPGATPEGAADAIRLPCMPPEQYAPAAPPPACAGAAYFACATPSTLDPGMESARFFWMRSTPSGTFYAGGGVTSGKNGAAGRAVGLYRRDALGSDVFAWSPQWFYRDWGRANADPAALRARAIPFGAFEAAFAAVAGRAKAAGLVLASTSTSPTADLESGNALVDLVMRDPERSPCFLLAVGLREAVPLSLGPQAVGAPRIRLVASVSEDALGHVPLVMKGALGGTALQTVQMIPAATGEMVLHASAALDVNVVASFHEVSGKEWTGERDEEGRRWMVVGVPAMAVWLSVVRSLAQSGQSTTAGYVQLRLQVKPGCFRGAFSVDARVVPWWSLASEGGKPEWSSVPPWKWPESGLLPFHPVPRPEDLGALSTVLYSGDPKFRALTLGLVPGTGATQVRMAYDFQQVGLNPPSCPQNASVTYGSQSVQFLAAYGRTRWADTWEFRRGADQTLDDLAVWGAPVGVNVPDALAFTDQRSALFWSPNGGASYTPIGSRGLVGTAPVSMTAYSESVDAPRWRTQGYGNMLSLGVLESPPLGACAKPAAEGRRSLVALTDDGGVFLAKAPVDLGSMGPFADVTWNLPRTFGRLTPEGLGPPADGFRVPTTYTAICHRLAANGAVEMLLASPALGVGTGVVALSRDGGSTWTSRRWEGLPPGEVMALVSTVDPLSDLLGTPGPVGVVFAAVRGRGIFRLPAGSDAWEPMSDLFAPRPAFPEPSVGQPPSNPFEGSLSEGAWQKTLPGLAGQGTGLVQVSLRAVLLEQSVLPALWKAVDGAPGEKPVFDAIVKEALVPLAMGHAPAIPLGAEPATAEALRRTGRVLDELVWSLLEPSFLAVVRDAGGGSAVYAAVRAPGAGDLLHKGVNRVPVVLSPPTSAPKGQEWRFPELAASTDFDDSRWKEASSAAMCFAGLYQLFDAETQHPHPADAPLTTSLVWRQVAGVGLARGAVSQLQTSGAFQGDALTPAEVAALNYPQAWRAITSMCGSSSGTLAATCENVEINRANFSVQAGLSDELGSDDKPLPNAAPQGAVFVDGGVFVFEQATTASPKAKLLFTHPKPGACAWVEQGFSGTTGLYVGLNAYEAMEGDVVGDSTECSIAIHGALTGAVPAPLVRASSTSDIHAQDGTFRSTPTYFAEGAMRWPVGIFRWVQGSIPSVPATPPTSISDVLDDIISELDTFGPEVAPPTTDSTSGCSGGIAAANPNLVSVSGNWCCAPQRYFHLTAGRAHVYAGTANGGMRRIPLALLPGAAGTIVGPEVPKLSPSQAGAEGMS